MIKRCVIHAPTGNEVFAAVKKRVVIQYSNNIRDHEGLRYLTKTLTRNQPHNTFMLPWQYWLGITKLKSAFSMTWNVATKFYIFSEIFTNRLPD